MTFLKNGLYNVFIYGSGLIIVNGLSFGMLPIYTRYFIPADYAVITLLLTCLPFTRYCLPLEICQATPVLSADEPSKIQHYVSVGFWFTVLMNLICYLIFFLLNLIFQFIALPSLNLFIIFILLLFDCLFYFSSNVLRWQLKHGLYNFIISFVAILEVLLVFLFVFFFKFSILGVFYAWLISRSLGFIFVYISTKQFYAFIFNLTDLKKMLAFSGPLVLSNIPYNLNRGLDRWMIAKYLGLSAVGVYGAGAVISGVVNFIMGSISASLTPFIYRNHARKEAPIEIVKLFYFVLTFCFAVALFFALFNKEILCLLVAKKYYLALAEQPIVPLLIMTSIFSGLFTFFPGLSIKRKTTYVVWFNMISLSVNLFLSYVLISKLKILGVACAICFSTFINVLLYIIFSQRFYPLAFKRNHVITLIILLFFGYVTCIYFGMTSQLFYIHDLWLRVIYFIAIISIYSAFIWKIFRDFIKHKELVMFLTPYSSING